VKWCRRWCEKICSQRMLKIADVKNMWKGERNCWANEWFTFFWKLVIQMVCVWNISRVVVSYLYCVLLFVFYVGKSFKGREGYSTRTSDKTWESNSFEYFGRIKWKFRRSCSSWKGLSVVCLLLASVSYPFLFYMVVDRMGVWSMKTTATAIHESCLVLIIFFSTNQKTLLLVQLEMIVFGANLYFAADILKFFNFKCEISELCLPIAMKFCNVVSSRSNF